MKYIRMYQFHYMNGVRSRKKREKKKIITTVRNKNKKKRYFSVKEKEHFADFYGHICLFFFCMHSPCIWDGIVKVAEKREEKLDKNMF